MLAPQIFPRLAILVLIGLLPLVGCDGAATNTSDDGPRASSATSVSVESLGEQWDVFQISGTKVGFGKTTYERDDDGNLTTTAEHELEMKRFGQTVKQTIMLSSTSGPDGELIRCESRVASGPEPVVTHGEVRDGRLHLTTVSQGKEVTSNLKWDGSWGGYFASDLSLIKQPMQPGEKRTIKSLAAIFNQLSTTEFTAGKYESTKLLDGKQDLLRIEQRTTIDGQTIPSTMWVNREGIPQKMFVPGIRQTSYRVSKERAQRKEHGGGFDLGEMTIVKARLPVNDPHKTPGLTYRATLDNGNPAKVFLAGTSQQIKSIDEHTAEITVLAVRPGLPPEASPHDKPPGEDDLAPNSLIQSDNAKIVAMANAVLPAETDHWKLALGMERYVRRAVKSKNFSQAFATAAEVADSLEGDCTEHSVLLAALCRARKVPARVAIGLVYYRPAGGFAYHMWNEVWIEDRWIPLDGTLGQGGIGSGHLKIAHANLAGSEAYSVFLPAQQVIGQLSLKVSSVEAKPDKE